MMILRGPIFPQTRWMDPWMDPHGWVGSPWIMVQHCRLHKESLTPFRCGLGIRRRRRLKSTCLGSYHSWDTRLYTPYGRSHLSNGHRFNQIHRNTLQLYEFGEFGSHQCADGAWCQQCWQSRCFVIAKLYRHEVESMCV